jgi:hypothetical protein
MYNHTCLCCGRQEPEIALTIDHVVPLSKGGAHDISNIQPLCGSCNTSKYNKTIDYRKVNVLGVAVDDSDLTAEQLARVHGSIVAKQKEQAQRSGQQHKPARTAETVQAWFAKVYQVKPQELEAKWAKFCLGVVGRPLSKGPLSEDELNKLNSVISQAWQRQKAASGKTAA